MYDSCFCVCFGIGIIYVTYSKASEAALAIEKMNGKNVLNSHSLKVITYGFKVLFFRDMVLLILSFLEMLKKMVKLASITVRELSLTQILLTVLVRL